MNFETDRVFDKIPTHLAFDNTFLEFVAGLRMFPWSRRDYLNSKEIFPQYCMPDFKVRCRFLNLGAYPQDAVSPLIRYECTCNNPYSLHCLSFSRIALFYWVDLLRKYTRKQAIYDPFPKHAFQDIILARLEDSSNYFKTVRNNPLWGLQLMFAMRTVAQSVSLGLTRDGYHLHIQPRAFSYRLKSFCQHLEETKGMFSFNIKLDCFPHYRF